MPYLNLRQSGYYAILLFCCLAVGSIGHSGSRNRLKHHVDAPAHPIIYESMLLGGSRGGKWLSSTATARMVHGGETYQQYSLLGRAGHFVGGKASKDGSINGQQLRIGLNRAREAQPDNVIGVSGSWNGIPRPVRRIRTPSTTDIAVVRRILDLHNMRETRVQITGCFRVDLRADRRQATIIIAGNINSNMLGDSSPKRGDYSCAILYWSGASKSPALVGDFCFGAPGRSDTIELIKLLAIADLNGDGTMEIVLASYFYENQLYEVYSLDGDKLRQVLSGGDGDA